MKSAKDFAFEHIMSQKVNTMAELTSKHIDNLLKKSSMKNKIDEGQIKLELDKALQLFLYLPAKDVFEAFYNKRLTRRLLMNLSQSLELEKDVIAKFKMGILLFS